MLRSLFSGISGLRAHQQMMDVTGNNIANVNTTGYKTSQTVFQDTLSQMVSAAGSPQGTLGGTNPSQIGLGVRVASVNTNFGQGSAQTTGKASDMMVQGDGFFVVKDGGESLYTRAGSFTFDANGALTTPNGQIVQGWSATDGKVNNAGAPSNIVLPVGVTISPTPTTKVTLTGNLSVDAQAGVAADVRKMPIKAIYNADGAEVELMAAFEKQAAPSTSWTMTLYEADGVTAASDPTTIDFTAGRATGNGTPDEDGNLVVTTTGDVELTFDVSGLTQFAGPSEARVSNANGSAAGNLRSYTVSNTGEIVGVFSNGLTEVLGQVALANFNNVEGLEKVGGSMFRSTTNSGLAQVGQAGTTGLGMITSGALEMSNVDLAQEFTNLVVAQRGFQANSRVITTSDEILQELVNLKR
jgi:flagellar hook protein FlgE